MKQKDDRARGKLEIKPLTAEFASAAAELEAVCFSQPRSEKALIEETEMELYHDLAAFSDGAFCGYIGVCELFDRADVTSLAVFPEYRGQRTGGSLLSAALEGAKERGRESMSLEVRISNIPAITLYKSKGFKIIGERKNFYSHPVEDGLIMSKDLRGNDDK